MWIYKLLILTSCLSYNIFGESINQDDGITVASMPTDTDVIEELTTNDEVRVVTPQNAIIAIQIINTTSETNSKINSKRTIEASLGYGSYQGNNFYYKSKDGKFEIYPYSQHDIPPSKHNTNVNIQPAQSFVVGKTRPQIPHQQNHPQSQKLHYNNQQRGQQQKIPENTQQYYLPPSVASEQTIPTHTQYNIPQYTITTGHYTQSPSQHMYTSSPTTLFSTFNHGQIGAVSPHIPTQFVQYPIGTHGGQQLQVPVIILRVYSDQLQNPHEFYPNLPADNPYANYINSINLQTLLSGYIQNTQFAGHPLQHETQANEEGSSIPLSENYPDDVHTKVIIPVKKSGYKKHKAAVTSATVTPLPSATSKLNTGNQYLPVKHSVQQISQPSAYVYQTSSKSTSSGTKSQMAYAYPIPGKSNINPAHAVLAASNPHIAAGHNLNVAYAESTPTHPASIPHPTSIPHSASTPHTGYIYTMPVTFGPHSAYMYTHDGGLIPIGNPFSIPGPHTQNYYNAAGVENSGENIPLMHLQLTGNHLTQNSGGQQARLATQEQYVYINEKDLQSGGYIYQDPHTKQLMYMPHQTQNSLKNVKYVSPEQYNQQLYAQYTANAQYNTAADDKVSAQSKAATTGATVQARSEKSVQYSQSKKEST